MTPYDLTYKTVLEIGEFSLFSHERLKDEPGAYSYFRIHHNCTKAVTGTMPITAFKTHCPICDTAVPEELTFLLDCLRIDNPLHITLSPKLIPTVK